MAASPRRSRVRTTQVRIDDIRDFAANLGRSPAEISTAIHIFEGVAGITVAKRARMMAESQGGVAAKSAKDIRSAQPGVVVYGGQGYNFGAEFGAYRYKQFKEWRGNQNDAGYFLWPEIRIFRDKEMLYLFLNDLHKALAPSFPSR